MKRIIRGKQYNTATAKKCGEYQNIQDYSDINWFSETLYKKKGGEFFLHGDGNANSKYSKSCGPNEWCGSEKIIPMTYAEAQEWSEQHLTGDEYEMIFGEIAEDDSLVQIHVSMTAAESEIIRRNAAKENMTVSAYIVHMCAE